MHRLVDGIDKLRIGEVGLNLASASKSAGESSAGSTAIKPSAVCGPQEAFEEITPTISLDTHCGETKMVEILGHNSQSLSPVVFPKDVWDHFLHSAWKNTKKGIETCGK